MKNLFALVGFGTIAFVGLGWYLGWYNLSRQPGTPGTQKFSLEVNPTKIAKDGKTFIEKGGEIIERLSDEKEKAGDATNSAGEPGPATQLFTAPSAQKTMWNSLENAPPPIINGQPVSATPSTR